MPLKIAGDGPLADELRERAARHARSSCSGSSGPELAELLGGAAMAVVPSLGGDVMPFAALEAMAAGVPVVASSSGSLPELLGAGALRRRAATRDALAAAMGALWDDPRAAPRRGRRADRRARASASASSRYVDELLAVYDAARTRTRSAA